jgi:hypothetical protein
MQVGYYVNGCHTKLQGEEIEMSEQQSNKAGVKSSAQKEADARHGYEPRPASNAKPGAFGDSDGKQDTDSDAALNHLTKRDKQSHNG